MLNLQVPEAHPAGFPSLVSHLSSLQLIHPIVGLPLKTTAQSSAASLRSSFKALQQDLPCELHLLNLRMMQNKEDNPDLRFQPREDTALLLHRLGVDCSFPSKALLCTPGDGKVSVMCTSACCILDESSELCVELKGNTNNAKYSRPRLIGPDFLKHNSLPQPLIGPNSSVYFEAKLSGTHCSWSS